MITSFVNPWGRTASSMDVQRSDLWLVDLVNAQGVDAGGRVGSLMDEIQNKTGFDVPNSDTLQYLAKIVTLPPRPINPEAYYQDNYPVNQPGYNKALEGVRITFLCDQTQNGNIATLVACLEGWKRLVEGGRLYPGTSSASAQDPNAADTPLLATSGVFAAYLPIFAFDLDIELLGGVRDLSLVPTTSNVTITGANVTDTGGPQFSTAQKTIQTSGSVYYVTETITLERCWLGELQYGELDSSSNNPYTITATVYPRNIFVDAPA